MAKEVWRLDSGNLQWERVTSLTQGRAIYAQLALAHWQSLRGVLLAGLI